MMDFVNPGLLGTQATFQKVFAGPIEASQDLDASPDTISLGQVRAAELTRIISPFQLRRTSDVNLKYLPPCTKYVVMCRPTEAQVTTYRHVLQDGLALNRLTMMQTPDSTEVLSLIGKLRQVCNHPALAAATAEVCFSLYETQHFTRGLWA
jgi:DNA repair and recombination protein RAD54B